MKETKEPKEKKSKQVTTMTENTTPVISDITSIDGDITVTNPLDTFVLTEIDSDVNIKELAEFAYKYNQVVMREKANNEKQTTLAQKYITTEEFTKFNETFDTVLNLIKKYDTESEFMKIATSSELSGIQAVIKYYVNKLLLEYDIINYNIVMTETEFDYFKTTIKNHIKIYGDDMIKMDDSSELLKAITKETIQKGGIKSFKLNVKKCIDLYNFFAKHNMTGVTTNFDDFRNIMLIFNDIYKLSSSMYNLCKLANEYSGTWVNAVAILESNIEKK